MSATARDVIAKIIHPIACKGCRICQGDAELILKALDAAGFAIVPKEPTEALITKARASLDRDGYDLWDGDVMAVWKAMLAAGQEETK